MELWAHRGSHEGAHLENTLPAFEQALLEAADGIELDVHLSADGVPMVFHDETLIRLTPNRDPRRLEQLSSAELEQIDLVGGAHMPTLAEALDLIGNQVPVNVEIKDATALTAVGRVIKNARTEVILSSFEPRALYAAADLLPKIPRAVLMGESIERLPQRMVQSLPFLILQRARAVAWHTHSALVVGLFIRTLTRLGITTRVWTVNDAAHVHRLAARGIGGVFTDGAGRLRAEISKKI